MNFTTGKFRCVYLKRSTLLRPLHGRRYRGSPFFCWWRVQLKISQNSKQKTTAHITIPPRRFRRVAVTKAKTSSAIAGIHPRAAATLAPSFRSCRMLSNITADVSSCPPTCNQPPSKPVRSVLTGATRVSHLFPKCAFVSIYDNVRVSSQSYRFQPLGESLSRQTGAR